MNATPRLAHRLRGIGTSIFAEMTALAVKHDAVNLGQGFPDFDGPEFVKAAAIQALSAGHNQYARMPGLLPLAHVIAGHQRRFYGIGFDPETEITVHAGATEALFATLLALLDEGDELIAFEPYYDAYPACATLAGAALKAVALEPPGFDLDVAALEAALTPRSRVLLLNSPNNPAGKVFSRAELGAIAAICERHDLLVVTDEVYEHIVFDGQHLPFASLPGMRERTVTISSTGKTFSLTGWKIGYSLAPPALAAAIRTVHQFAIFAVATPFQHAMATALATGDDYFVQLAADYRARRDRLCDGLGALGLDVIVPAGTYFALADIRPLGFGDDVEFCRRLPEAVGVAAIPVSAFCRTDSTTRHLVRFAFCKRDETLGESLRRLQKLRSLRADS
jgi:N-succinyldiaminopimelate aminotransferase